jgi:large subunit ribosomal protein L10
MKRETKKRGVSPKKASSVKEMSELANGKKTILIASIKSLPASQFQEISKKLRGKAVIKVPKKNLILRVLENAKNEKLREMERHIGENTAILFSDTDSFDLASDLLDSKSFVGAKAGQEAPEDIEVPAGPTELVPGPAISELGALGIQIQIEKGKISIKQPKVIVKKGEKISENAAGIMNKLDIKPFQVGFVPLTSFDSEKNAIYLDIKIDKEGAKKELVESRARALAFAVEKIGYISRETISFLIGKAGMYEKAIERLLGDKPQDSPQNSGEVKE